MGRHETRLKPLPRNSNQIARGRIRRFESYMPSHAVVSNRRSAKEKPAVRCSPESKQWAHHPVHPDVQGCQCNGLLVGTTFPSAGGGVGAQKAILRLSASYALYRSRMAAAAPRYERAPASSRTAARICSQPSRGVLVCRSIFSLFGPHRHEHGLAVVDAPDGLATERRPRRNTASGSQQWAWAHVPEQCVRSLPGTELSGCADGYGGGWTSARRALKHDVLRAARLPLTALCRGEVVS